MKTQYWTVFGSQNELCSKHTSVLAALRSAKACERRGGFQHRILRVEDLTLMVHGVRVGLQSGTRLGGPTK